MLHLSLGEIGISFAPGRTFLFRHHDDFAMAIYAAAQSWKNAEIPKMYVTRVEMLFGFNKAAATKAMSAAAQARAVLDALIVDYRNRSTRPGM